MLIGVMMAKWSDDSACWVVHDVMLYSVLDTVVISDFDVCCSVVFGRLWSICEVVVVPYVDAVVTVTKMRVLLFVLHVCMLRECEIDGNAGVGDGWGVVVVSAVHVSGTRGSGIVSSAADKEAKGWLEPSGLGTIVQSPIDHGYSC